MKMKNKKNKRLEFILRVCIFSIPFFSGAFLYGVLDWNSLFHTPILFMSVIITYILLNQFNKIKTGEKTK